MISKFMATAFPTMNRDINNILRKKGKMGRKAWIHEFFGKSNELVPQI